VLLPDLDEERADPSASHVGQHKATAEPSANSVEGVSVAWFLFQLGEVARFRTGVTLGRVALVTGGTGALGGAVTRRLLEDGHRVAVTCVHEGEVKSLRAELGEAGSDLVVVKADVTDEGSVGRGLAEVRGHLGAVEVLVHLVGGWHGGESVHEHSLQTWQRIVDLNLTSAFLCCRAVLPEMLGGGWGRVVLVSSRTAKEGRANVRTRWPKRGWRR
jgi:NAD(P)-dependent dehydrogenase (short-subunit alcohol dehydrogenase family)